MCCSPEAQYNDLMVRLLHPHGSCNNDNLLLLQHCICCFTTTTAAAVGR